MYEITTERLSICVMCRTISGTDVLLSSGSDRDNVGTNRPHTVAFLSFTALKYFDVALNQK